jgi:hypothetical protein
MKVYFCLKEQYTILSLFMVLLQDKFTCILSVRAFSLSLLKSTFGFACEISGMMVTPECPPTTGTFTFVGSRFCFYEHKTRKETH